MNQVPSQSISCTSTAYESYVELAYLNQGKSTHVEWDCAL